MTAPRRVDYPLLLAVCTWWRAGIRQTPFATFFIEWDGGIGGMDRLAGLIASLTSPGPMGFSPLPYLAWAGAAPPMPVAMRMSSSGPGGGGNKEPAKKRGTIDQSERKFNPSELKMADKLAEEGHDVKALPASTMDGVRSADALVDGGAKVEFKEIKQATNASSGTIKNTVEASISGRGQARNIMMNAGNSNLSEAEAQRGLSRVAGIENGKLDNIRIIGKDFDITRNYP